MAVYGEKRITVDSACSCFRERAKLKLPQRSSTVSRRLLHLEFDESNDDLISHAE
jgi:hypothetical protein